MHIWQKVYRFYDLRPDPRPRPILGEYEMINNHIKRNMMKEKKNILMIMPYSPVPPTFGGALREYYLLKHLAARHRVTVLTYGTPEQERAFNEVFGDQVAAFHVVPYPWRRRFKRLGQACSLLSPRSYSFHEVYSVRMQDKIDQLVAGQKFHAVHCEFSVMGQYTFPDYMKCVVDNHNVEYCNFMRMGKKDRSAFRRWFYMREGRKVYQEETEVLRRQNLVFSTSEPDREIFRKDVPNVSHDVIPNGVDTTYFRPSNWYRTEPWSMVFTGMMGYVPNNDGIIWFLDEIFPQVRRMVPNARVYVVGNSPSEELKKRASAHVIVTGFVEDVRPFVWRSNIFVVPLRMGSGTRLKVVEALAMKKPVVSTRIGCEGIDVRHEESVLIEDEPAAFAQSIVRLMQDRLLRERLSQNGFDLISRKYAWPVIGERLLKAYDAMFDIQGPGCETAVEGLHEPELVTLNPGERHVHEKSSS